MFRKNELIDIIRYKKLEEKIRVVIVLSFNLSANPNITWNIVRENPDIPWDWDGLSKNPNITWEIVRDNPDKHWDWNYISRNPIITWEIVRDNPDRPWDYAYLSENPNITWEIVRDNPDKPWSWIGLSLNIQLYNLSVNKKSKTADILFRKIYLLNIFEKISYFSRNIDKIISKKLNYK